MYCVSFGLNNIAIRSAKYMHNMSTVLSWTSLMHHLNKLVVIFHFSCILEMQRSMPLPIYHPVDVNMELINSG